MTDKDIDNLTEQEKVEYVVELERLDSNYFKVMLADYATMFISTFAYICSIVSVLANNKVDPLFFSVATSLGILNYCFDEKQKKMKKMKAEITEKLGNEEMGKGK